MRRTATRSQGTSRKAGAGCLIAFGIPFFLFGAFIVEQSIYGRVRQGDRVSMGVFGFVFSLVGAAIIAGGIWGSRAARRKRALREAHADEPWLVNAAWAGGRIYDASGSTVVFLWGFALVWNTISYLATFAALRDIHRDKAFLFVLLFPAVGAALLGAAIYQTVRRLKFGRSLLELETMPGCVGGWLAGTIQTRTPILGEDLHVRLRSVRRVTRGSGKNRSTDENVLWEDEQLLTGRLAQGKQGGSVIPISFKIPAKCRVSDDSNSDDQILWRLRVHAAVPGADYVAEFVVPVFDAAARQAPDFVPAAERAAEAVRGAPPQKSGRGDDPRIQFLRGPGERKRFVFPAARNPGAAATITIFALAFAGAGMVVQHLDGPIVIAIIVEVIGAAIAWGALSMWFRVVELSADAHGVQRNSRLLGLASTRTVPAEDVSDVLYETHTSVNDTAYYTISAKLKQGGTVSLISGLRARDAEWIAGEIAGSLGVHSTQAAVPAGLDPD